MAATLSYGLDPEQLRAYVIRPALQHIRLWSLAAERLVLGTAMVESGLRYLDQIDSAGKAGPAYGLWQMEGKTHNDILLRAPAALFLAVSGLGVQANGIEELHGNLFYAAAMCRAYYRGIAAPLPASHDALGMANYWKLYYNTPAGKGITAKALPHFTRACELG